MTTQVTATSPAAEPERPPRGRLSDWCSASRPIRAGPGPRFGSCWPWPTQIEQYVKQGKLHYVLAGGRAGSRGRFGGGAVSPGAVSPGRFRGGGGAGGVASVLQWVEQNCAAVPASAYRATANTGALGGTTTGGLYRCG